MPGDEDVAAQILEISGSKGVNVVFDPVGAGRIDRCSPALARDARIYFYGTLDKVWPQLPFVDVFQKNTVFHPDSVFDYVGDEAMCAKGKDFIYRMLAEERIRPKIDRVYPMKAYVKAFDYLSQPRKTHGKVVIEIGLCPPPLPDRNLKDRHEPAERSHRSHHLQRHLGQPRGGR